MLTETPPERRLQEYRMRQFLLAAAGAVGGFIVGVALNRSTFLILMLAIAGFAGGGSFWRGKVDRAIEDRTARMRIELYTINQLLAMRVRVGGGVVSAVRAVVDRGLRTRVWRDGPGAAILETARADLESGSRTPYDVAAEILGTVAGGR